MLHGIQQDHAPTGRPPGVPDCLLLPVGPFTQVFARSCPPCRIVVLRMIARLLAQLGIGGAIFWYLKTTLYGTGPAAEPKQQLQQRGAAELVAELDAESKHTSGHYWRESGGEDEPRRPG